MQSSLTTVLFLSLSHFDLATGSPPEDIYEALTRERLDSITMDGNDVEPDECRHPV